MVFFIFIVVIIDMYFCDFSGKLCVGIRRGVYVRFVSIERYGLIVIFRE